MTADEAMPPVRIKLFGSMEVEVQGAPLPKLRSRSELWVLALLALQNGRPVTRTWLAQSLWPFPDHATDQASYNLRRGLTNLRKALGPEASRLLSLPASALSLDLSGAAVDAASFEAAIGRGDPASLQFAVSIYSGPLMLECTEAWAAAARARYEQDYLSALRVLASQAVTGGDFDPALGYLRLAIATDPLCEPAQRSLMETLARNGDVPAALTSYQEFSRRLHRERNAMPAPEMTELYRTLRAEVRCRSNPPGPAASLPESARIHRLPAPLTPLVGRKEEIDEIQSRFRLARLLTLTGTGGIGKTRLAIHLAEEKAAEFRDGVCFVDLAGLTDPGQVWQMAAAALELPEERAHTLTRTLTTFLRPRQLLIILDNCEHLVDACAQLAAALLQDCRDVRILATSRQSLGVAGEAVWRVASLSLPDPAHLRSDDFEIVNRLKQFSAIQLFVERAIGAQPMFRLSERNGRDVARICARLEGIPLALELAAARLGALPVEHIAERLNDRFQLLTQGPRTALSRQQTLEATIKWSFDLLAERDGELLRALSVFSGGWSLQAAEWVGADIGLSSETVADTLARLVDQSLVIYETDDGRSRYRFLETVRQYCCLNWMDPDSVRAAAWRHLNIVSRIVAEAEPHLQGPRQSRWFSRLDAEHDNVRAALDWSAGQKSGSEQGLRLAAAIWRFWHRRGYLSLGRRYLENELDRTSMAGATPVRAEAAVGAGMLAFFQGDATAARQWFDRSLVMSAELADDDLSADALHSLGQMEWNLGSYADARAHFNEALALRRNRGDPAAVAVTLNYLGIACSDAGDYDEARGYFEESLHTARDLNDKSLIASALHGLAHMAFYLQDFLTAQRYYAEELHLARRLEDRELTARTLHRLGCVEYALKNYPAARKLFEESLDSARELAYLDLESAALHSLGSVARADEDYVTAHACFEERLTIGEERGDKPRISYTLDAIAGLLTAQNDGHGAITLFAAAQALREGLSIPSPANQEELPRLLAARAALGEEAFAAAWEAGRLLTPEEAIDYARRRSRGHHTRD